MFQKLLHVLRNPRAAIDLASIMVGIIILGIIGGIIAATVFAIIPWSQDKSAQAQLDSLVTGESANAGITDAHHYTADIKKYFDADSAGVKVYSDEVAGYAGFIKSATGKNYYVTSNNTKPQPVPTPWPTTAPANYPANVTWPVNQAVTTTNLASDPGYDTKENWNTYYSPAVSTDTSVYHSAGQSMKITTNGTYDGVIVWQTKKLINGTYTVQIWMKAPAGTVWNASLRTDGPYSEGKGENKVNATGDWQLVTATATLTEGTYTLVGLQIRAEGVTPSVVANFDDVGIYYSK